MGYTEGAYARAYELLFAMISGDNGTAAYVSESSLSGMTAAQLEALANGGNVFLVAGIAGIEGYDGHGFVSFFRAFSANSPPRYSQTAW